MFFRRKKPASALALRCSFCNKSQYDVKKLVAGPKVQICDECVGICNHVFAEERPAGERRSPETTPVRCSLCRQSIPADEMLPVADRGLVCRPCVAAVRKAAT